MAELRSSGQRFRQPPVVETALAIQFEELVQFKTVHFGAFRQTVMDRFPVAIDQPRLDRIVETFPMVPVPPFLKLMATKAGPERVWFCNRTEDATLLLQVQPDRFGLNWRRTPDGTEYVRFGSNGPLFLEEFRKFEQFCADAELGDVKPDLCEVIYVNHVFSNPGETAVECMQAILNGVTLKRGDRLVPELATFNRVYPIGDRKGRLYAEAAIAQHRQRGDFVLLKMTARVVCRQSDDLAENLQAAHDSVVNGFLAITSAEARSQRWEQES